MRLAVAIHAGVPIWIGKTHVRASQPEQRRPKLTADKRRQPPPMRRIRIHRRHQHQSPHLQTRIPVQTLLCGHHRNRAAMRSPQQIKRRNSQIPDEPQKTPRRPPHGMIKPGRTIREPRSHHVRRIHRRIRRQSRHRKSPRKRISQQPMHQNQRRRGCPTSSTFCEKWNRGRAQIPHARAIHIHPALFHPRAQSRTEPGFEYSRNFPASRRHHQIVQLQIFSKPGQLFPRRRALFK